ncbi:MAG: hypothetical protein PUI46_00555 [Lachnospiraceae bacterium]|nr:hypothetical protein [Lachnospiraceae bacterium]MDY5701215.1 hypothetical protein [Lachnospiraceae bacterium]
MDNFIDKLAQKFTAGEVIKANQAAEEGELRRLREQVAEYERCLQEMRKLQMRNTEAAESLKELLEQSKADIRGLADESLNKITRLTAPEGSDKRIEETLDKLIATAEKNQKEIAEWFRQADDFLHKENVKVYRNVQAVVTEESKTGREAILAAQDSTAKKYYKKMLWVMVLTFLAAAAGVIIQVMDLGGMF